MNQILTTLKELKRHGMVECLETQDILKQDLSFEEKQLHDLFNIIDERYKIKSTIITSQLPTSSWHAYFKHPTMADAILDRLLSQTDKFELSGDSLRWDENKDKLVKNWRSKKNHLK